MQAHKLAARILAILGTVLVWLPLLAPLFFDVARLAGTGRFQFDYLMPAELFPVVLVGSVLLIVAAVLARSYRRLIIGGFVLAVVLLVGGQALAVVSGLASGETQPQGIWWALVVALFVLYICALIALGTGGILLLRRLFGAQRPAEGAGSGLAGGIHGTRQG